MTATPDGTGNATRVLAPYAHMLSRPLDQVAAEMESFAALLLKWNRAQNLVSRETVHEIWPRHIADSLQILPLLKDTDRRLLDLGSGGGFPAIPLAIATKGRCRFVLTEPVAKKASFLRTASRELGLGLRVEAGRAETLSRADLPLIDLVISRALAPLPALLEIAAPFLSPRTRAICFKGREHVDELIETRAQWHFDVVVHPSRTEAGAALLEISNLSRQQS